MRYRKRRKARKLLLAGVALWVIYASAAHAAVDDPYGDLEMCTERYLPDSKYESQDKAGFKRCMERAKAAHAHDAAIHACDKRVQAGELQPGDEIGARYAKATNNKCDGDLDGSRAQVCLDWVEDHPTPSARVTVTPPYQGPPPIGWVYGPYTQCANPPQCSMGVVNVQADGLNVRVTPNGPAIMSLVNGTPIYPLQRDGDWLLVAAGCDLTPTFAWSWTAGVPLNRCWVYF